VTRSETLPAADFESAAATESTALRTVAALYVDPRGPYPSMPGVDCWDERRDARNYAGPHPVVAHPPCGPWSRLRFFCRHQARELAPLAVAQVRRWLGVLEHPMGSLLWREMALPLPGGLPDAFGGFTVEVDQVHWGHRAQKRTWLYIVGCKPSDIKLRNGGVATHVVTTSRRSDGTALPECTQLERRLTPPAFAEFLLDIARRCAPGGGE